MITMVEPASIPIFDAHLHIIDRRFPLIENQGYLPDEFTVADYRARMRQYSLIGGAIVSGSFQGFDQTYLLAALAELGHGFVGVTQLPASASDEELKRLHEAGVRAVRFNLKRGGSEDARHLEAFAHRAHDLLGWHVELYVDAAQLGALKGVILDLPAVSIDHLGLSRVGFPTLLQLAERGVRVKATGFGRVDFDVASALRELHSANPSALMFGTDLPSTRAPRPYRDEDYELVIDALGPLAARRVLVDNACEFYKLKPPSADTKEDRP